MNYFTNGAPYDRHCYFNLKHAWTVKPRSASWDSRFFVLILFLMIGGLRTSYTSCIVLTQTYKPHRENQALSIPPHLSVCVHHTHGTYWGSLFTQKVEQNERERKPEKGWRSFQSLLSSRVHHTHCAYWGSLFTKNIEQNKREKTRKKYDGHFNGLSID